MADLVGSADDLAQAVDDLTLGELPASASLPLIAERITRSRRPWTRRGQETMLGRTGRTGRPRATGR